MWLVFGIDRIKVGFVGFFDWIVFDSRFYLLDFILFFLGRVVIGIFVFESLSLSIRCIFIMFLKIFKVVRNIVLVYFVNCN